MLSHDKLQNYLHDMHSKHSFRIAIKPHKTAKEQQLINPNYEVF